MSAVHYDDGRAYIRAENGEWGVAMVVEKPALPEWPINAEPARSTLADWLMAIALGLMLGALAGAGF